VDVQDPTTDTGGADETAERAIGRHLGAVVARDLAAYRATVHPDVTVIIPSGDMLSGADEVVEFHREWFAGGDWTYTVDHRRSTTTGATATAVVDVTYVGGPGAEPSRFRMGLTFTRAGGAWLLIHDQCTVLRSE